VLKTAGKGLPALRVIFNTPTNPNLSHPFSKFFESAENFFSKKFFAFPVPLPDKPEFEKEPFGAPVLYYDGFSSPGLSAGDVCMAEDTEAGIQCLQESGGYGIYDSL